MVNRVPLITRRGFAGVGIGAGLSPLLRGSGTPQASAAPGAERDFFYRPAGAWAADFIPFYQNGRFHLFYLLDWRDQAGHGEGTPWYQVSTTDFVHFTEHGEMLPRGSKTDQDLYVFTGSVVEGEGKFHIFYTGHNPHLRKAGKPEEGVMHAVSDDLLHWEKVPADTFFAPHDHFEANDWRDPFVFRNEAAGEYWMLTAARLKSGPSRRRGCTALSVSKDLRTWQVRDPLYSPGLYFTHECPDLFRMGDWWYLVFSEFSTSMVTRYRMSKSLAGPWIAPDVDTFDGRALYAAKTASDGTKRYLFGWNATRDGGKDYHGWNWGGNLVAHEIVQAPDGTLSVRIPSTVRDAFSRPAAPQWRKAVGAFDGAPDPLVLKAPGTFSCVSAGVLPKRCRIEATVRFEPGTHGCGLMLRASRDYESAYYVRIEPAMKRLVFDSWPRSGDIPFMVELERPLNVEAGRPLHLTVLIDGSVCVVYAGDTVALNTRLYNLPEGEWGVFVEDGAATFRGVSAYLP